MSNLFQLGDFTLASGIKSKWKIECEGLSWEDWCTLAVMAVEILPSFGDVIGVPRGGLTFAEALRPYVSEGPMLIVEDVVTSGGSLERFLEENPDLMKGIPPIAIAAFSRGVHLEWIQVLFEVNERLILRPRMS